MLRWLALGAWMVGCTTSPIHQGDTLEDLLDAPESSWSDGLPQAQSPPPRELSLSGATFIEVGTTQRLTVSGAEPGSTVRVIAGVFSEDYMCPEDVPSGVDVVLPDCVDIQLRSASGTKTHILLPAALADGEGVAVFDVTIPDSARARLAMAAGVHFQALQWGDPGGISSATAIALCDNSDGDSDTDCPSTSTGTTTTSTGEVCEDDPDWVDERYGYYSCEELASVLAVYADYIDEVCAEWERLGFGVYDGCPALCGLCDTTGTTSPTTTAGTTTATSTTGGVCADDPDWVDEAYGIHTCDTLADIVAYYSPGDPDELCSGWDEVGMGVYEGCPVLCGVCEHDITTTPTTTDTPTTDVCEDDSDFELYDYYSCEALDVYATDYGGWLAMCDEFDLWAGCPASCGLCDDDTTTTGTGGTTTTPTTTGPPPPTCSDVYGSEEYIADGYCDSDNNNAACGFDGGDCCPSDCDPDSFYGCAAYYTSTTLSDYRPSCEVCLDPESVDNLPGGECYE